jgi:hypothetical protein
MTESLVKLTERKVDQIFYEFDFDWLSRYGEARLREILEEALADMYELGYEDGHERASQEADKLTGIYIERNPE